MNIFHNLPEAGSTEFFETLFSNEKIKIERILSNGQVTPPGEWYDQAQSEWVLVLQGAGTLTFEDESEILLEAGDHLFIPAKQKHRVSHTAPKTLWLAIHFN